MSQDTIEQDDVRDLVGELDFAVRGDRGEHRASSGTAPGGVEITEFDYEGNVVRSWDLTAEVALELADGGWLSGFELGYGIDLAADAVARRKAVAA